MVPDILLVGIGGFIGATLRYLVAGITPRIKDIPAGTLTVNTIGSFIMAAMTFASVTGSLQFFVCVGILGSFTTFSTFAYESFRLLEEGDNRNFLLNIALNLTMCLFAAKLAYIIILQ
ncbi:MAG: fluoride efflux transporter CrcB [Methanolobus sp.]|nr:fluoride efflux transporter CrcB [Methanolobus sp.]